MADGVQYVLDRMSGLFRQLRELEIFTADEVGAIVKRRTDFEYVMKRRQLFIEDFYGYLQYEINLDKLRALRCQRLEKAGGGGKERQDAIRNVKSLCSRHICSIFDRATRRFPNNMDIWADYIAYLKEAKCTSVLNAVFGKALSLHPKNQDFWIQAAVHELDENNNVHAARVLFQRALRSNKSSQKLWLRYFELELWNSARIMERNKMLGLESSPEALFGAPVVVFKHALLAVEDLDMALDMYRVADGLQDGDFTSVLLAQMRDKFSGRAAFWGALVGFSDAKVAPIQNQEQQETTESQTKKRKKEPEQVELSVMDTSAQRLERLLKLLQDGKDAVALSNEPGQTAAFALIEANSIQKGLRSLWETLRSAHKAGKLSASVGENLAPKKKGKEKGVTDGATKLPPAASAPKSCLQVLTAVAARFAIDVPAMKDATAAGKFPAVLAGANGMLMMPLLMSAGTSSHLLGQVLDLLKEAFPHSPPTSPELAQQSSTCRQLAELLKRSAKYLTKQRTLSVHAVESAAWNAELEAVKHWCGAFGTCYAAAKDSKALMRGGKSPAEGLMKDIADAGSAVVSMALCLAEGNNCITKTLEALDAVGSSEEVTKCWHDIIASAQFHFVTRGEWCVQYLDWCLKKKGNDSFRIVQAAHAWIDGVVKASVPATVGGDMTPYYARLLDVQVPILKSNLVASIKGSKAAAEIIAFTRAVAERATTEYPKEAAFFDTWEDVERMLNNHAAANHVRWKRDAEA